MYGVHPVPVVFRAKGKDQPVLSGQVAITAPAYVMQLCVFAAEYAMFKV